MVAGTVDAVVVGAGSNGLVAANVLTDAGWDVIVLEAGGAPGGSVRSAEVTAPGYLSDLCSAFYPLGAASPALAELELDGYGLAWRHAPDVLAHLLPDGRAAVLNRDPWATARSVAEFAPDDEQAWLHAYARWRAVSRPLLDALFAPFPPVRSGVRVLRALRAAGAIRLARRFLVPAGVLADELFAGEGARLLLAGCARHTDLGPGEAGSGVFGWLLAMLGQEYGFPVPVGGAQRLTDALVARLVDRGGRVECGARVDRVLVAHGRALGVRTADGRLWRSRRAVLADVPAPALYLDLVGRDRLPSRLADDLDHFRWDGSTVKVDWALSSPLPWRNPAAARAGTVHLGSGPGPDAPLVILGQMTTADPARSPEGTESAWAYTHLPHRPQWTTEEVRGYVERIESAVATYAPGFDRYVVGRYVAGPADLEAENPSLVGGAIGGGTSAAYQQLFLRPVPGLGRADTPVDRLFLASASAHPGGGVHGVPGRNAARAALARDRRLTGSLYRAAIQTGHRAVYG